MSLFAMAERRTVRLGYLAVVASALLFSAKSVFIKMCFTQGASPSIVMFLRAAFALPFFLALAFHPRFAPLPQANKRISRGDILALGVLGLLGYYLASVLDIVGLQYVSAGTERLILFIYPSLVVVFSALFYKKPIPTYMFLPLIFSYAGIALSFGGEVAGAPTGNPYLGGGLVFMSAVCYAIFLIGQGRMVNRIGSQRLGAFAMLFATGAVFIHFLVSQSLFDLVQPVQVYLLSGLTAVFGTVLPVFLVGYGIQVIGPSRAAVVSTVGPVSTYFLSALWLGEKTGFLQVAGLILVLLSSFILARGKGAPVLSLKEQTMAKFKLGITRKLGLKVGTKGGSGPSPQTADKAPYDGGEGQNGNNRR